MERHIDNLAGSANLLMKHVTVSGFGAGIIEDGPNQAGTIIDSKIVRTALGSSDLRYWETPVPAVRLSAVLVFVSGNWSVTELQTCKGTSHLFIV